MEGIQNFGRRLARGLVSWRNPLNQIDPPTYEELTTAISKISSEILKSLQLDLEVTLLENLILEKEFEAQKEESNIQIQALIDEKEVAEAYARASFRKFAKAWSKWCDVKTENAIATQNLENDIIQMNQEQHEMIIELFEVQRRSRELENEISLIKCKQLPKQQEPEIELECGQGLNPSIEEVQEEERLEVEEENVMVAETEFGRDFVMDLDEQDQQQAEVIQQLVKDNLKLQSTLSEYQQRYFSPALLDNEKYQSERDLLEIKRICDENIQLKEENDGLKRQAHQREIGFERVNPSSSRTPMKIIGELLHDREGRDAAEEWAKELAFELKIKETNEYNLTKTIDDLKNKVAMLKEAKHSAEIKKEALVHDKRMVQMHCDLLDQQLKEASLGSDNNNIKYPMTKRIEELEGLLKKFQEEAEKAKQEAVTALGEQHIQLKRPSL